MVFIHGSSFGCGVSTYSIWKDLRTRDSCKETSMIGRGQGWSAIKLSRASGLLGPWPERTQVMTWAA